MTPADPRRRDRLLPAVAAIVAATAYSSFVFGPVLHSHLPTAHSFVSELEAAGQPYRQFFRATDILSGVLIVAVAAVLARRLGRPARPGGALIAVMGIASVTDSATRMGCAPSLDAACRAQDSSITGLLSQVFEAHTLSGLAGFLGGSAGMILLGLAQRPRSAPWGRAGVTAGIALAAVGLVDLALLAGDGPFGLAERGRALVVSLWLLGAAVFLIGDARHRPAGAANKRRRYDEPGSRTTAAGSRAGSATGQA